MYVCICMGVTSEKINEVIENGATTVNDVCSKTGAGRCCGGCRDMIEEKLEESE